MTDVHNIFMNINIFLPNYKSDFRVNVQNFHFISC